MAMTVIIFCTVIIVCVLVLGFFVVFDSEEEPEWHREDTLLPVREEVSGNNETSHIVGQPQSSSIRKPETMQVIAKATRRQRVA